MSSLRTTRRLSRIIGAYYAKAHEQFHSLSEALGGSVGVATRIFAWSIVLFLAGVALLVAVAARRL
jgi:hypothetical protein